ncbi:MAG TPA: Ig-like domain-containing protein, partial [Gemmatimonadales bacterium]|nr:Ig-like domain-containing protein [Gemmatimonadales bacterium]
MTSLRVLLLLTLGVLPIQRARAQGTQPLRKAELVRMLARRALSKPQIATLVRRNCVTFQPTAHDRAELRAAGADDAVLAAIDQCLRARLARSAPPRPVAPAPARPAPSPVVAVTDTSARAAPPPPPPPPPRPVMSERLTQFTGSAELHGTVGSTLPQTLVLEVRDTTGAPFVGQPVTITTSSGTVTPGAAESDASGVVRVRVTLGERAGPTTITARVGTLTRTVLVRVDPGLPEALVVERGETPVVGSLTLRSRDTVVLRVVARDRYGNRTALEKFAATTTARAIALTWAATDAAGSVTLVPRRSGVGELTLSGSGLRARLPVDVVLPSTAMSPWGIGARTAWLGANHPWIGLAGVTGIKGANFSIFGRRTVVAGLSLALGATAGSLNADQTTGSLSLQLLEGYGRAELALAPRGTVSPVLSLGAGAYRLKSGDNGQTVYHTNLFWSGGVGADVVVTP